MPYTEVTVTGYNATPPPDDGSTGSDNQVTWAGIKTKLGDPLKTALESVDDNVASVTAAIETRLDTIEGYNITSTLYAPSGTIMLFRQTAAPTGWTKDTTNYNNDAIRVTTGTVGSYSGGQGVSTAWQSTAQSTSATTLTESQLASHDHTDGSLTTSSTGSHRHTYSQRQTTTDTRGSGGAINEAAGLSTKSTGSAGTHSHTVSGSVANAGSGSSHTHTVNISVDYVDVIFATKD